MNITLNPAELAVASRAASKRNAANASIPAWTPEQWVENVLQAELAATAAAQEAELLDLMRPVGAEIAAAAGGDIAKITAALETGKTAALKTLA